MHSDTVFYVRIWDVDRESYLLFKEQASDGTFQRVGSHMLGLTEDYQGVPLLELPISVNEPLRLSHLWTWGRYEVREVRKATTNPIESEWNAFWNNTDLDRTPTDGVWAGSDWMQDLWLDNWGYVREITCAYEWKSQYDWIWGVTYCEDNGARVLHFYETITVHMTNRYKYSSGNMTILKDLVGYPADWGVNEDTLFHAKVWAIRDPNEPEVKYALLFEEIHRADFDEIHRSRGDSIFRNIGYMGSAGEPVFYDLRDADIDFLTMIPFSVNSPALVIGLPAYDDYYYFVEEFFADGAATDHITVSYLLNGAPVPTDGLKIEAEEYVGVIVQVQNEYAYGTGNLVIVKELCGFPDDWEVDEFTEFFAAIRVAGTTTFLEFSQESNGNGMTFAYRPHGSFAGDTQWLIPFSAASSAIVNGLPANTAFEVVELCADGNDMYDIFTTGFEVDIAFYPNSFERDGNIVATVTNRFEHGVGVLEIEKALVNEPPYVDDDTVFYARVRDSADTGFLSFILLDEATNTWRRVSGDSAGEPQEAIPFSVNMPAILTNLWSGRVYVVEEMPGDFTPEHDPLGIMWNGDVLTARITNHFETEPLQVTFEMNGGVYEDSAADVVRNVNPDDTLGLANVPYPSREGWNFLGWQRTAPIVGATDNRATVAERTVTYNRTYTAQWERVGLQVTFVMNNGLYNDSGADVIRGVYHSDSLGEPNVPYPSREGWTFLGWQRTAPTAGATDNRAIVAERAVIYNRTYTAQWSQEARQVTFEMNGGEYGSSEADVVRNVGYGDALGLANVPYPSREGWNFLGWQRTAPTVGATDSRETVAERTVTYNRTYTAQWERRGDPPAPAVEIRKRTAETVVAGDSLTYTITVENTGNVDLTGLVVTDSLPAELQNPRELEYPSDASGSFDGQTLTVTLGVLVPGETATITFMVTVAAETEADAEIRNTATVADPNNPNVRDGDRATTIVSPSDEEPNRRQAFLIGCSDEYPRLIRPRSNITRAEVATIFFRLVEDEVREEYWSQTNPFTDVAARRWFNNAISTTHNMGLFQGVSPTQFAPQQAITRGELAAVLVRFMDRDSIGQYEDSPSITDDEFDDISNHWARAYINEAAREGWVRGDTMNNGMPTGTFRPSDPITRAETAAMINRMFERLIETPECRLDDMVTWPDNQNQNSWYYLYIYMATNSYTYQWRDDDSGFKELIEVIESRNWKALERPDSVPGDIFR